MGWLYGAALSQLIFSIGLYKNVVKGNNFTLEKIKSIVNKGYVKKISIFFINLISPKRW